MKRPYRHLRRGDRIGVIAPAGPCTPERVALVEPLFERHGLHARLYPGCHARHPDHDFLAGDDATRLADLHAAFADAMSPPSSVCAVAGAARGCSTASTAHCCARIPSPWSASATSPHCMHCWRARGWSALHAPMPGSNLVLAGDEDDARALFELLMQPLPAGHRFAPALAADSWRVAGRASGRLVGGNLAIVASLLGTPWAWPIDDAILFLEEVSEAPYRVDRLLTQLRHAGVLRSARGFLLGSFSEDGDATAVLREHLAGLGKPVLAGWPAGHARPNRALPLGAAVTLDAGAGTLTLDEAVLV